MITRLIGIAFTSGFARRALGRFGISDGWMVHLAQRHSGASGLHCFGLLGLLRLISKCKIVLILHLISKLDPVICP